MPTSREGVAQLMSENNDKIIELLKQNKGLADRWGLSFVVDSIYDTIDGFDIVVKDGKIISARINKVTPVDGLPTLKVNTNTGSGAIIRPIINSLPVVEKKLQQVIDCIN